MMMNLLTEDQSDKILEAANDSSIINFDWRNRGEAPRGYTRGMALTYGQVYLDYTLGSKFAIDMAKADHEDDDTDGLTWYQSRMRPLGWDNKTDGPDTLRHLFVLLLGLGMRESSGRYCEGRDRSADNVTADTAEAGLFQMSWNARSATPLLPELFGFHLANPWNGFLSVFSSGVSCHNSDLANYGSGPGAEFQHLCKSCPAFAVKAAAIGLRHMRTHWGPINRHEAQVVPAADVLFKQVQGIVDGANVMV